MPVLASERRFTVQPDHPLADWGCPVLVFAGIEPDDRKPAGWTTGAAVAVHASCAGVPREEPEKSPRTVTLDITDADARHVLVTALEDYAARARDTAAHEGGHSSFERWADLAERMRAQAEAAG
jgi:hypothetical protein